MDGIHWVLLTLAMAVVSLGMSGIVKALGALTAFLIGSICLIYGLSSSSQLTQKANIWRVRRVEDKESRALVCVHSRIFVMPGQNNSENFCFSEKFSVHLGHGTPYYHI